MLEDYIAAKKLAEKSYKNAVTSGKYPYLPSLEDWTTMDSFAGEEPLGIMDIPLNRIAGTRTIGRKNSFAPNFLPLFDESSEFAMKWSNLYDSQLEEGIREPIKVYEYLSRYYVQEGNKRVSVMTYVGAPSMAASVTRLLPKRYDDPVFDRYDEYVKFFTSTKVTSIYCDILGNYEKLCNFYHKSLTDTWTDDEIIELRSDYARFEIVYSNMGGSKIAGSPGDAFVKYLEVYGHHTIHFQSQKDLRNDLMRMWSEFKAGAVGEEAKIMLSPSANKNTGGLISHLFSNTNKKLKIGFVYPKTPETSGWTYSHELGRQYLADYYKGSIETFTYFDAETVFKPSEILNKAVEDGCNIIFTTTAYLGPASLKCAIANPNVKILNCGINSTHSAVRTYCTRLYETKFLLGVIAGALCKGKKIGYIADYPIFQTIANINAFALGAKVTNPDAKIQLTWNCLNDGIAPEDHFDPEIELISGKDFIIPDRPDKKFGLYRRSINADEVTTIAATLCDWGKFYQQIVDSIKNDSYKSDSAANKDRAINYWWGISAGVTELICSAKLPIELSRMISVLTEEIAWDRYRPFDTELIDNEGNLIQDKKSHMSHTQIMRMNWLLDNVEGRFPTITEMVDEALNVVMLQGELKDKKTEEKDA